MQKENENIVQNGTHLKVLGLHWFTKRDSFEYNFTDINILAEELPITKRNILKIYVLGLIRNDFTKKLYNSD